MNLLSDKVDVNMNKYIIYNNLHSSTPVKNINPVITPNISNNYNQVNKIYENDYIKNSEKRKNNLFNSYEYNSK